MGLEFTDHMNSWREFAWKKTMIPISVLALHSKFTASLCGGSCLLIVCFILVEIWGFVFIYTKAACDKLGNVCIILWEMECVEAHLILMLNAVDQRALRPEPSRKCSTRAQIWCIHSRHQKAALQPWRENLSTSSSHDMAGAPKERREGWKKSVWKGNCTDSTGRGRPEGAGQNRYAGEGGHVSQKRALQAARAAAPGWWCGWPGAMGTRAAQHWGPGLEQSLHSGHQMRCHRASNPQAQESLSSPKSDNYLYHSWVV